MFNWQDLDNRSPWLLLRHFSPDYDDIEPLLRNDEAPPERVMRDWQGAAGADDQSDSRWGRK
jgi:hypothetical protein